MVMLNFSRTKPFFLALLVNVISFGAATGCTSIQAKTTFEVGQIYDVSRQQLISFEDLLPQVLAADVIFIGEEHYTPSHIEAAQKILNALVANQRHPALALEMFSWDGQDGLDRYLQEPGFPTERLLEDSHWNTNWGGEFADYQPLVIFVKSHQLRIIGFFIRYLFKGKVASMDLV